MLLAGPAPRGGTSSRAGRKTRFICDDSGPRRRLEALTQSCPPGVNASARGRSQ